MKIGDLVSVIDDDLSGVVTSLHGEEVVFRDEHGFTHQYPKSKLILRDENLYDKIKIEKKPEPSKNISKKHNKNPFILDLHFEKLVPNPSDYQSFERLFIQKEKLLETLDFCKKHRLKKLEIIHGIGDGVLQKLVTDTLESKSGLTFHHNAVLANQSASVIVELD